MSTNVGHILHRWAREDPARVAIIDAGAGRLPVTYGALDDRARQAASTLRQRGLGPGDRVAICMANGVDFVAAWFGSLYAGCTTLPISMLSTAYEIRFLLEHARCNAVITDHERTKVAEEACALATRAASLLNASELEATLAPIEEPAELEPDAVAMILYTSGTTGSAKGVCVSHASLQAHTTALVQGSLRLTADDRVLGTLPFNHSYGIRMTLLAPFIAGATCIFVPRFNAANTLELIVEEGVTWLAGVPTMFSAWANTTDRPTPETLRWCLSAGAALVEDVRLRAEARLNAPVRQGYGLTEATFSAINAPPAEVAPGSVGEPTPGVEIRIGEPDKPLPPGRQGEVLIRGQNVMQGYLDDLTATKHVMRGGWLHTGDVGVLDAHGRLTVVDRTKDIIIRGGRNIYPSEVENVLSDHPSVAEVAVVGQMDTHYGEEVVAVLVPSPATNIDPTHIDSWLRERLSATKVPHFIAIVDALPHGKSGKIVKRMLRDQLEAGTLPSVSCRRSTTERP